MSLCTSVHLTLLCTADVHHLCDDTVVSINWRRILLVLSPPPLYVWVWVSVRSLFIGNSYTIYTWNAKKDVKAHTRSHIHVPFGGWRLSTGLLHPPSTN